jgi:hypothetical protein
MRRRLTLGVLVAVLLGLVVLLQPRVVQAQAQVTAQILNFWNALSNGLTYAFVDAPIQAGGYITFNPTTLGANGYGIRDNGGQIQFKNLNGSWANASGGADPTATFLLKTADTNLPNSQSMAALGTGLVFNTTTTGVQSIYTGTSCTNQFPRSLTASGVAGCQTVNLASDVGGILPGADFPALIGDVTSVAGALATTLKTVNVNVGTFGSATVIPSFTVNGKGLIIAAANNAPQFTLTSTYFSSLAATNLTAIPGANITGTLATAAFPSLTGDVTNTGLATTVGKIGGQSVSLGGALTFSGAYSTTITVTGNTSVTFPTSGTLLSTAATSLPSLATVGTIGTGTWQGTAVTPVYGGTGLATATAHGAVIGEGTGTMTVIGGCTNGILAWTASSSDPTCAASPLATSIGLTGSDVLGGTGVAGAAATTTRITKVVTGIADATATSIVTVTVPNGAEGAVVRVHYVASLGAGGAIGAFECSAALDGSVSVTRTSGVATVASPATATLSSSSCVAGATTITLAYDLSSITGAAGATQTFSIRATVSHGGGSSTNHQVVAYVDVTNASASGVTVG